jgi:REP element-mobilizing transposase RayT
MKVYHSLSHMRRDCKYHVVFIPKRRKKRIFGVLRRQLWRYSTSLEENMVRAYIRNQEEEDERYEQMKFGIHTRRLGRLIWRL